MSGVYGEVAGPLGALGSWLVVECEQGRWHTGERWSWLPGMGHGGPGPPRVLAAEMQPVRMWPPPKEAQEAPRRAAGPCCTRAQPSPLGCSGLSLAQTPGRGGLQGQATGSLEAVRGGAGSLEEPGQHRWGDAAASGGCWSSPMGLLGHEAHSRERLGRKQPGRCQGRMGVGVCRVASPCHKGPGGLWSQEGGSCRVQGTWPGEIMGDSQEGAARDVGRPGLGGRCWVGGGRAGSCGLRAVGGEVG